MKNLISRLIAFQFIFIFCVYLPAFSISLTGNDVKLLEKLKPYLDVKPEGAAIRELETALKNENPAVRGLVSLILYKNFGRRFRNLVLRNFTVNQEVERFEQSEIKLVRLEDVNKLLAAVLKNSSHFSDERLQKLFLFYHLRQKNVWLRSKNGEDLSMAIFYRIAVFDQLLTSKFDPIKLAAMADKK